jgi:hypothetical protein
VTLWIHNYYVTTVTYAVIHIEEEKKKKKREEKTIQKNSNNNKTRNKHKTRHKIFGGHNDATPGNRTQDFLEITAL